MRDYVWLNDDGLQVGFGPRNTINADAGEVHVKGIVKQIKCDINAEDLGDNVHQKMMEVPAESVMRKATFICNEAFDAPIEIGTYGTDNVVIAADGILAATTPLLGDVVDCLGTQMNLTLAADSIALATGAATVGRGQLLIEYVRNDVADL